MEEAADPTEECVASRTVVVRLSVDVRVPAEPPDLSDALARVLLRILRTAAHPSNAVDDGPQADCQRDGVAS